MQFGVEDKRQTLLRVVFGREIALLFRAIRRYALSRIVNPADDVIEVRFLPNLLQVCGKLAADLLIAFADRVTRETAAAFEELFTVSSVATLLFRQFDRETVLPQVGRDRLDLLRAVLVAHMVLASGGGKTPERRHLRAGTEALRVLEPNRNPF